VGLVEYLSEISLGLRLTQLVQKFRDMFNSIVGISINFRVYRKNGSGPVTVEIHSGPRKKYQVNSVFGAIHALSVQAMPPDRPLGEYIVILYLFQRLVAKLKVHLSRQGVANTSTSTSIALLASFVRAGNQLYSRAVIGFSLTGTSKRRRNIIKQRKENLPALNRIKPHRLEWLPGNCAESETFACYTHMYESLRNKCGQFKIFTISLTLNIAQGFPVPLCRQCSQHAEIIIGDTCSRIIDLAS